ncbi:hypothetical protein HX045_03480 [Myroides odoratimimus]|uniref:Uncharacterized protein n=4 Tax=Myroides TaxID=76831 RepID=A0A0S7EC04_9FLAO|nr:MULTISPECIES: hypothetical protein [Myroides]AJA69258.1 hypothetical protein MYRA21_2128 [Myroides sp. A21]AJH14114.1 hypothetical protein MPR_0923 [Myroides profundi]ALU26485.1 hypothetical protein AS202_10125 [Myroides odoratimimus]APA92541.1 hypothetical protein BK054_09995 [Myroides sp. ZB35]EHO12026.1 hypothetical protein HMPREF9712_00273 [Myroides odoratimimus CCUG 10230]
MELPKFVLADNTEYPEDIFIIHLEFPRFIINLNTDEVEFLETIEESEEAEIEAEMEGLIVKAGEFYEREMERYVDDEELDEED